MGSLMLIIIRRLIIMERTENLLEASLSEAAVTGTEEGMGDYISGAVEQIASSEGNFLSDSCDRCDCVCNQPCHGQGPCYSL
jgi:hypothetical protein